MREHTLPPATCDGRHGCQQPITHMDEDGYTYCGYHADLRRSHCRVRRLKPAEVTTLVAGGTLATY